MYLNILTADGDRLQYLYLYLYLYPDIRKKCFPIDVNGLFC